MTDVADERSPLSSAGSLEPTTVTRAERRAQFECEVLPHLDSLYTFALKLTREPADAEDLVSQAVVRAFDHWEQYTLGTNARAWMFTILYHAFVSARRSSARETFYQDSDAVARHVDLVANTDVEADFYDSIIDEEVTRAIDSLPVHYREAVLLSDVHDFRYAEIAKILRVPEGTAKSRIFRGREMLRRKLLSYAVEMGYIKSQAA